MKIEQTLCWQCRRSVEVDNECSWARNYTPVEGWTAEYRPVIYDTGPQDSYMVYQCPLFLPDKPREPKDMGDGYLCINGTLHTWEEWAIMHKMDVDELHRRYEAKERLFDGKTKGTYEKYTVKTYTARGETHTLNEWAAISGLKKSCLRARVEANRVPFEDMLLPGREYAMKSGTKGVFLTYKGMTKTINEWAEYLGVPQATLSSRRKRGLPIELILKEASK